MPTWPPNVGHRAPDFTSVSLDMSRFTAQEQCLVTFCISEQCICPTDVQNEAVQNRTAVYFCTSKEAMNCSTIFLHLLTQLEIYVLQCTSCTALALFCGTLEQCLSKHRNCKTKQCKTERMFWKLPTAWRNPKTYPPPATTMHAKTEGREEEAPIRLPPSRAQTD